MRRFDHRPLLGTLVEILVDCPPDDPTAERVDAAVVATMTRLEQVFSVYDASSELPRRVRDATGGALRGISMEVGVRGSRSRT